MRFPWQLEILCNKCSCRFLCRNLICCGFSPGLQRQVARRLRQVVLNEWCRLGGDFGRRQPHGSSKLLFCFKCCHVRRAGLGLPELPVFQEKQGIWILTWNLMDFKCCPNLKKNENYCLDFKNQPVEWIKAVGHQYFPLVRTLTPISKLFFCLGCSKQAARLLGTLLSFHLVLRAI